VDELERVEDSISQIRLSLAIETRVLLGERLKWNNGRPDGTQVSRKRCCEVKPRLVYSFCYMTPLVVLSMLSALCWHLANALALQWLMPAVLLLPGCIAVAMMARGQHFSQ
jgi:hypothetical protein